MFDERPGAVVWITGLPSSGKSTFAKRLFDQLVTLGVATCMLDGDEVRACLVPTPGYDSASREAFYETLSRLAALLAQQGLTVLVPATANLRTYREAARRRVPRFLEVFVDVPLSECQARDAKGLYRQTRLDAISALPGAGSPYEAPLNPDVVAEGGNDLDAVARVIEALRGLLSHPPSDRD